MTAGSLPISERRLFILASLALAWSMFLHLGEQPVYLEEPRRATIAMEMEETGNLLVPTQFGEYYYRKPPLYNWVLMASSRLFGGYSAFALRVPTVLSVLLYSLLLFLVGRRYMDEQFGWLVALLYPLCISLYFYFALLAEIDLFYALLTGGGMLAFFHFTRKGDHLTAFLLLYGTGALGLLTKGLPSVLFTGITVVAWLAWERKWRVLFSWPHAAGILLFGLIGGGYLWAYDQYHPVENYLANLWSESSKRTVAGSGLEAFVRHLFLFPLNTLKDLIPALFLLPFLFRKDLVVLIRRKPLLEFALIIFLTNYLVYWLAPGAKERYIYMLYPFLIMLLVYAWQERSEFPGARERIFRWLSGFLILALVPGSIALALIPDLRFLPYLWGVSIGGTICFASLFYLFKRYRKWGLHWLILATIGARFLFDLTILPQRAHDSQGVRDQHIAGNLLEKTSGEPVYLYGDSRISFSIIYYYNLYSDKALRRTPERVAGNYYLLPAVEVADREVLLNIPYDGVTYALVKW